MLVVDDPDKSTTEFSVAYLYDLIDERMARSAGSQRAVLLLLNLDAQGIQRAAKLMFWRNQEFCTPNRASKPSVSTEHEFSFALQWRFETLSLRAAVVGVKTYLQPLKPRN